MNFKVKNKLVLGLTGGILTGKSAALAAFKACGAAVFSCDETVHEILQTPAVKKQLLARFATTEKGKIAQRIFSCPADKNWLEKLVHPRVLRKISKQIKNCPSSLIVVEVPLLFEVNLQEGFDLTVLVCADKKLLFARAKQRGLSRADFVKRSGSQMSQDDKMTKADVLLCNNASPEELGVKVNRLCRVLGKIYAIN